MKNISKSILVFATLISCCLLFVGEQGRAGFLQACRAKAASILQYTYFKTDEEGTLWYFDPDKRFNGHGISISKPFKDSPKLLEAIKKSPVDVAPYWKILYYFKTDAVEESQSKDFKFLAEAPVTIFGKQTVVTILERMATGAEDGSAGGLEMVSVALQITHYNQENADHFIEAIKSSANEVRKVNPKFTASVAVGRDVIDGQIFPMTTLGMLSKFGAPQNSDFFQFIAAAMSKHRQDLSEIDFSPTDLLRLNNFTLLHF